MTTNRMKSLLRSRAALIAVGAIAFGAVCVEAGMRLARADGAPTANALYYAGSLEDGGQLVNGTRDMTVRLWKSETSTMDADVVCSTISAGTAVSQGRFRIALGSACVTAVRANPNLWAELIVGSTPLPRRKIGAVPYALEADHAVSATTASAAGGGLASSISSLQSNVDGLLGRVDLKVFRKAGNNGTVSCDTFCAGSQWGAVGTCVASNINGAFIPCSLGLGITNASVGTCWCSAP